MDRWLDKQRDTGGNYEAQIKSERRGKRVGKFSQPIETQQFDERNLPPDLDDDIREFLGRR